MAELDVTAASARPWSQPIAWVALRTLDDEGLLSRLDREARYRLRQRLFEPDPAQLLATAPHRLRARINLHPSSATRRRDRVVPSAITGAGAHGFGLTRDDAVDGYLSADTLADARAELRVRDSSTGAHLLRVVDDRRVLGETGFSPSTSSSLS